ncbi:hypothetical protein [Deinococcus cellulosilyticus]|uniref:Secreted protein n=1 Tax=Deinococcus cellulosilyticus (strain DSM 18568 / NBRC 106333 / KACC 11606 / 5516J-15) TaxID=1223518 RepID=A0A511N058_DEIC1|nr:hypothetical protein [Deinococcus cellulosilyticus]GEM45878.1 hypothetical protein DC3_15130 [Deinococcus cellulosilyticus NBRC 106333 = KACC 11606]
MEALSLLLIFFLIAVAAAFAVATSKPQPQFDSCDYQQDRPTSTHTRGIRRNLSLIRRVQHTRDAVRIVPNTDPGILWDALNGRR